MASVDENPDMYSLVALRTKLWGASENIEAWLALVIQGNRPVKAVSLTVKLLLRYA